MKKVLSIALALIMTLSAMVMLVPTASAAETADVSATGSAGQVYYEEDFDDAALADLVDKDLSAALGWSTPDANSTMWIEDGAIRIVSQYGKTGEYPINTSTWGSSNTWAGGYRTDWVNADKLTKNATVVEYTVTSYRRPGGSDAVETTAKDGSVKTIVADGQGSYQGYGPIFQGTVAGTDNWLVRFNPNGNGQANSQKAYDTPSNAADRGTLYWKSGAHTRVNAIPEGDTHVLEYLDNPATSTTEEQRTGKYYNKEYNFKIIVEPHAARVYVFVNNVLIETGNIAGMRAQYVTNGWRDAITNSLGFYSKPGNDLKIDNIKVSEFVPALTISEVMTNGVHTAGGSIGKYQWVEITNPGDANVNVYDYAIHLWNMANATQTIGNMVDTYQAGSGSTIGYFTPGAKTLANGDVFDSPSYDNGVLLPGESAIVLLPQTAIEGNLSVTDEAFNAYLIGLGMPETTKTFVVNPVDEYEAGTTTIKNEFFMAHLSNESTTIGIVKVNNQATDGGYAPVAPAIGQKTDYINAFSECTAIVTAKTGGGTNWYMMTFYETQYNNGWPNTVANINGDEFLGHYPNAGLFGNGAWTTSNNASYEVCYSGWYVDAPTANIQWGFQKYGPTNERTGINGTKVLATPGFVPVDCRRQATIMVDGNAVANAVYTDATVTATSPKAQMGYTIQLYVDGEYVRDVEAETEVTVSFTAAEMTNAATHSVEFKEYATDPIICRARFAKETGTIQLIAGINNLNLDEDTIGFNIAIDYNGQTGMAEYTCQYVYKEITDIEHGSRTADYFGFDYLFALQITNTPAVAAATEDTADLVIYVEAVKNGESSSQGAMIYYFTTVAE